MSTIQPVYLLVFSALLFSIGLAIVLIRKNTIVILMGVELILNAANINLIGFSRQQPGLMDGQLFALFTMVVAAAEASVALAIVIKVYRHYRTAQINELE